MRQSGQSLHALKKGMAKYPQTLVNVRLHKQVDVTALPAVSAAVRDAEKELAEHGRVLLRPSGTEPLVRVMVEGRDRPQVEDVAKRIARVVEEALASEAE